MICNVIY